MTTVMTSPQIRQGVLKDCKDILTIYQTTRWLDHKYTHVDEVKKEHQGLFFRRWGWLVAEIDEKVIGEIIFRTEENPTLGTVGIITSVDVDVRYQKHGVGRELVSRAEQILSERGVSRTFTDTPPEAYNFWMKLGYFARQPLLTIEADISSVVNSRSRTIQARPLEKFYHLPYSVKFSHLAPVGHLSRLAEPVLEGTTRGAVYELYKNNELVGSCVVARTNNGTVEFIADVREGKEELLKTVAIRAATLAKKLRVKRIKTIIPKVQWEKYEGIADWSVNDSNLIPITRLL
ncbi:MAG: GNAT family N-acetyltransferase [Candidatus Thorarchaeota archaeon]|nr:GNAT family N-acetyltransferase [Candidatus Thorarchaeota archaeon]